MTLGPVRVIGAGVVLIVFVEVNLLNAYNIYVMRKVAICAIHGLSCAKSRYLVCAIIHGLRSGCAIYGLIYTLSICI